MARASSSGPTATSEVHVHPTVTVPNATVLEKREKGFLCRIGNREIEVPLEVLWDEGDDLVVGAVCDLDLRREWARTTGLTDE
jgi:hypothetical protein